MKKIVVLLLTFIVIFSTMTMIEATSYTYVSDQENLFDDSADMIALCAEIRNKLDFNIEVITLAMMEDKEPIIEANLQDSQRLLIFVTTDEKIDYWAGSAVTKTIREVEFELLLNTYKITDRQYTKTVNKLLSAIVEIYINGKSFDDYVQKEEIMLVDTEQDSWAMMTFKYMVNFVKTHPIRIIVTIVVLVGMVLFYYNRGKFHKSSEEDNNKEE